MNGQIRRPYCGRGGKKTYEWVENHFLGTDVFIKWYAMNVEMLLQKTENRYTIANRDNH